MRLEGVLADQRKRIGGDGRGLAGEDFEIRQVICRRQRTRRQHDRQVAEAGIFGQHGEERIFHPRRKTFAEHDAVDVADVEVLGRRFERQRADHAHPLAERNRERRIARAAADQEHGGVTRRIAVVERRTRGRIAVEPAQHRGMQRPHPKRGAQPRQQAIEIAAALRERNGVCGQRACGIDRNQRKIGFGGGDLRGEGIESGFRGIGCGDQDRGGRQLRNRARHVGPIDLNDRK